jgi:transcriptional regulator with XRE-family HTH domain
MPARKKVGLNLIVGGNIRRLRLRKNMTQQDLADAVEAQQASISGLESGDRGASMLMVMNIAKALGVPSTSLFKEPKGKEI